MLNPGDVLQANHYQIQARLNQSGMSTLYVAVDITLPGRVVAIKENVDPSSVVGRQFYLEAAILAQLAHPNLPRVTDYFVEPSACQYLVMEYIAGDDLLQILRKHDRPLPEPTVLAWTDQVMRALIYMHEWIEPETGRPTPVMHRDIKPSNIKCTPEEHIVLVDFGLAQYETGQGASTAALAVTPGYSPVEQYRGATDVRSDIYALGATLYTLLTAERPPDATALVNGRLLPTPRQLNPRITLHTEHVILYAMRPHPGERFQTMAEMRDALLASQS